MATYKAVFAKTIPGLTLKNGTDFLLVEAEDATDAAALIQGHMPAQDDLFWAEATISEVTSATDLSPVVNPDSGETKRYVFTLAIAGDDTNASFTHTAAAGEDLDAVAAALVVLLNAHADIAGAAWATPILTLADVADDIGDHTVTSTVTYGGTTIVSFSSTTVDGDIPAAVLTQAYSVIAPLITHLKS